MKEPKKWWFSIPLPGALLASYIIWEIRMWVGPGGFDDVLECAGPIAIIGAVSFPIGLAGVAQLPEDLMSNWIIPISVAGYLFYMALSVAGMRRPSRVLFVVLCVLLVLNMAGCQMDRTTNAIPFK